VAHAYARLDGSVIMSVENFDADAVEVDESISCTFKLNDRTWSCRNRDEIDARIAGAILSNGALNVGEFFAQLLIPEEADEFMTLLKSDDFPLPLKRVQVLMEFLTEQVMNRPTVPPDSSGPGRLNTPATYEGRSSSRGTPRRRSAG
jgi:hypothetical protein